jgi:YVTN family beta-propeller protein
MRFVQSIKPFVAMGAAGVATVALFGAPLFEVAAHAQTVAASVAVGSEPLGVAVDARTNRVYVANTASGTVSVINGGNQVAATINLGPGPFGFGVEPFGVGVNPNTDRVYVTEFLSASVAVIDGGKNQVIDTVPTDVAPAAVAANPRTNLVYVANSPGTVTVIDGATDQVTATITLPGTQLIPRGLAVNPTTNRIYVANTGNATISVIDGATNQVQTIDISAIDIPGQLAVNTATNQIYVVGSFTNSVLVIDGAKNRVTDTIQLGIGPFSLSTRTSSGLAFNPTTNHLYATTDGGFSGGLGTVSEIDAGRRKVVGAVPLFAPQRVDINSKTNRVYISQSGAQVSVLADQPADTRR